MGRRDRHYARYEASGPHASNIGCGEAGVRFIRAPRFQPSQCIMRVVMPYGRRPAMASADLRSELTQHVATERDSSPKRLQMSAW